MCASAGQGLFRTGDTDSQWWRFGEGVAGECVGHRQVEQFWRDEGGARGGFGKGEKGSQVDGEGGVLSTEHAAVCLDEGGDSAQADEVSLAGGHHDFSGLGQCLGSRT